jgi:hypothetical protein
MNPNETDIPNSSLPDNPNDVFGTLDEDDVTPF